MDAPVTLAIFSLIGFASAIMVRAMDPLVSVVARDFAIPVAQAALLSSALALPYAWGQPILGPIGDFFGKEPVLKTCLWAAGIALLASALAPSFLILLLIRPVNGFVGGGVFPIALAMVGDRFPPAHRQLAIARFVMAATIGQVFGASASGLLAQTIGWRGVLGVTAALIFIAALAATFAFPRKARPGGDKFRIAHARGGYRSIFRNPNALVCFGAVFCEGLVVFGFLPYIADMLERAGAGGPREAGIVIAGLGAGCVLFSLVLPLLLPRFSRPRMMRLGGVIGGLGFLAMSFVTTHWMGLAGFFVVAGFGFFMLHNSLQTEVADLAPEARASAFSLHAFSFYFGQALGPMMVGLLAPVAGMHELLLGSAAILAITGFVAGRLIGRNNVSRRFRT